MAGRHQEESGRQRLSHPLYRSSQVIHVGGVRSSGALGDPDDHRVVGHGPKERAGRAAHAHAAQEPPGRA
eukprot:6435428-Alexandrium_andersonii.AAC.1